MEKRRDDIPLAVADYLAVKYDLLDAEDAATMLVNADVRTLQEWCDNHEDICSNEELWRLLYKYNFPDLYRKDETFLALITMIGAKQRIKRVAAPWRDLYTQTLAAASSTDTLKTLTYLANNFEVRNSTRLREFILNFPAVALLLSQFSPMARKAIIRYGFDLIALLAPLSAAETALAAGVLPDSLRGAYKAELERLLREGKRERYLLAESIKALLESSYVEERLDELTNLSKRLNRVERNYLTAFESIRTALATYGNPTTLAAIEKGIIIPVIRPGYGYVVRRGLSMQQNKEFRDIICNRTSVPDLLSTLKLYALLRAEKVERREKEGVEEEGVEGDPYLYAATGYDDAIDIIANITGAKPQPEVKLLWAVARNDLELADEIVKSMKPTIRWKALTESLVILRISPEMLELLFDDLAPPKKTMTSYIEHGEPATARTALKYIISRKNAPSSAVLSALLEDIADSDDREFLRDLLKVISDKDLPVSTLTTTWRRIMESLARTGTQLPQKITFMSLNQMMNVAFAWAREMSEQREPTEYEKQLQQLRLRELRDKAKDIGIPGASALNKTTLARRIAEREAKDAGEAALSVPGTKNIEAQGQPNEEAVTKGQEELEDVIATTSGKRKLKQHTNSELRENLIIMTRKDLYNIAKERKLAVTTRTKKDDLINILLSE